MIHGQREQKRIATATLSDASSTEASTAGEQKMEVIILPPYYRKDLPPGGLFSPEEHAKAREERKKEKKQEHKEPGVIKDVIKTAERTEYVTDFGIFGKPKDNAKSNLLGKGNARVKIVEEKGTGIPYALKIQNANRYRAASEREILILKRLNRFKGQFVRRSPSKSEDQIYTVMQLLPGKELYDVAEETHYKKLWNVSLQRRIDMCISVLRAVREFHTLGFWHRDLKLQNLFYDFVSRQAFVLDFETAIEQGKEDPNYENVGTPLYRAPDRQARHTEADEVFALGKTLAVMLLCHRNEKQTPLTLKDVDYFQKNPEKDWTGISDITLLRMIVTLLNRMTDPKKENRPALQVCFDEISQIWSQRACEVEVEKVFVFNVADFFNATAEEKSARLKDLKKAHEVWLLDTSDHGFTTAQLRQLQREMANNHIILHDQMFRQPGIKPEELFAKIQHQYQKPGRAFDYFVPKPLPQPRVDPKMLNYLANLLMDKGQAEVLSVNDVREGRKKVDIAPQPPVQPEKDGLNLLDLLKYALGSTKEKIKPELPPAGGVQPVEKEQQLGEAAANSMKLITRSLRNNPAMQLAELEPSQPQGIAPSPETEAFVENYFRVASFARDAVLNTSRPTSPELLTAIMQAIPRDRVQAAASPMEQKGQDMDDLYSCGM